MKMNAPTTMISGGGRNVGREFMAADSDRRLSFSADRTVGTGTARWERDWG